MKQVIGMVFQKGWNSKLLGVCMVLKIHQFCLTCPGPGDQLNQETLYQAGAYFKAPDTQWLPEQYLETC